MRKKIGPLAPYAVKSTWILEMSNGELFRFTMPAAFQAHDLADKYANADIYLFVPKGASVLTLTGWSPGPCYARWNRNLKTFHYHSVCGPE